MCRASSNPTMMMMPSSTGMARKSSSWVPAGLSLHAIDAVIQPTISRTEMEIGIRSVTFPGARSRTMSDPSRIR